MSDLPGPEAVKPEGYDEDIVESVTFTLAELDMMYFTCLAEIGHPEAQNWVLTDDGFDTLLVALTKIHEYHESQMGEPDLVAAQ